MSEENGKKPAAWNVRRLECPEDLFGPERYILLRPMKMSTARRIRQLAGVDEDMLELQALIAPHVIEWNVIDSWSDEPLSAPAEDAEVMDELDTGQWLWLLGELQSPNRPRSRNGS